MKLSYGIEVYLLAKEISPFSPNTLRNYRLTLSRLCDFFAPKDPELTKISAHDLRSFLHKLQTRPPKADYHIPQETKPLDPKSIRNVHATLSSFWNWAVDEDVVEENIAQAIEPPKPKRTVIEPFDEDEIKSLLQAAGRDSETTLRLRDRAILFYSSWTRMYEPASSAT